jgi:hypothetical protein
MKLLLVLWALPLVLVGQSPKKIQPGKMYESGEPIFSPHYGIHGVIPGGWSGLLPQESEVFLLSSITYPAAVFVFASDQGNLDEMKKKWENGIDMDDHIRLKAKAAMVTDGILNSEVVAEGPSIDKSKRSYAAARCSAYGPCITLLSMMAAPNFDEVKKVVDEFIRAATFEKPSSASPYDKFDWRKFIAGKTFTTYAVLDEGSKETWVDLCADGTFKASVSKKGIMKNQNPAYRGTLTGTWTAEGVGETGKLYLEFKKKKLPVLEAPLSIREDKIYVNEERYFVATSQRCK